MIYTDLSDHPFSPASVSRESGAPDTSERAWLRWCAAVERMLGHSLDGNQAAEGYSLDYAYDAFAGRVTAAAYVEEVRTDPAYQGRA